MNELPIIDGDNAIDAQEFADHAQEVLEAIGYSQLQKYALFKPKNSGFWEVDWHLKWRRQEYSRLYDVVAMRCRGQAAITLGVQLTLMCPVEHRAEYEYAKESYLQYGILPSL